MILNVTYGTNVENAPEGFKTTVAAVTQFFQTTFTDPVTINIKVEYAHLGSGLLGHSDYNLNQYTYAQITNALKADANSNDDASAAASLPAADPISGYARLCHDDGASEGAGTARGQQRLRRHRHVREQPVLRLRPQQRNHRGPVRFLRLGGARIFRDHGTGIERHRQSRADRGAERLLSVRSVQVCGGGRARIRRHQGRLFLAQRRRHQPEQLQHRPRRRLRRLGGERGQRLVLGLQQFGRGECGDGDRHRGHGYPRLGRQGRTRNRHQQRRHGGVGRGGGSFVRTHGGASADGGHPIDGVNPHDGGHTTAAASLAHHALDWFIV